METIYINGIKIKEVETKYGTLLKLGINVDKFVSEMEKHKNEKGYVNLNVNKRKEVGQYGDTHSVSLDTWKPEKEETKPKNKTKFRDDLPF